MEYKFRLEYVVLGDDEIKCVCYDSFNDICLYLLLHSDEIKECRIIKLLI